MIITTAQNGEVTLVSLFCYFLQLEKS